MDGSLDLFFFKLTELTGPKRFYEEIIDFIKKKATSYFILNTSDLRAVPLTTKMVMDYVCEKE
jgi:hypothetical protein